MAKDINKKQYTEETQLKLDIFEQCFREWLPVFLHNPFTQTLHVFDFFAGSGYDTDGHPGSAISLLKEMQAYCKKPEIKSKNIHFTFNEALPQKSKELQKNITEYISKCEENNNCVECNIFENIGICNEKFQDLFQSERIQSTLQDEKLAKFIILDQYGFKEISKEVFRQLANAPKTDFIFFISSSFIRRFKDHEATLQYIDTEKINYNEQEPKECHRAIANYFKDLISNKKEYFIHHFTIKKGSNYYGLIFGTGHTLGMEKFLRVCWKQDKFSGESNCNINNDFEPDTLFHNLDNTKKKETVRNDIREKILSGKIQDNITGMKYALSNGCQPKLFIDTIESLKKENKVSIVGKYNKRATDIHRLDDKKYTIRVND